MNWQSIVVSIIVLTCSFALVRRVYRWFRSGYAINPGVGRTLGCHSCGKCHHRDIVYPVTTPTQLKLPQLGMKEGYPNRLDNQ